MTGTLNHPVIPHALYDFYYDYDKHVLFLTSAVKSSSETTLSRFL